MEEKLNGSLLPRPGRLARWVYRLPIALYHWNLGWLLGGRFLLLEHQGRKSGQLRETVLEVVRHDRPNDTYIVAVGFGRRSNWFKNLLASPSGMVQVGRRSVQIVAHQLSIDAAYAEFADYRRRHPIAVRLVAPFLQIPLSGNEEQLRETAAAIPMFALQVINAEKSERPRESAYPAPSAEA